MASLIETVYPNLKVLIQATLGSTYSELTHIMDIRKNNFCGAAKRWGLAPGAVSPSVGNTKTNTFDLQFSMAITDEYITDQFTDSDIVTKMLAMIGKYDDIWKQLSLQKGNISAQAHLISGFELEDPVVLEEEKIIVIQGRFFVRVQNSF